MTEEQIAALKVGDTVWYPGIKRRSYLDPGDIDVTPAKASAIARLTPMKFGLEGELSGGWRGPQKQRLRDMSELCGYYLTEQEADCVRDARFAAREVDDLYRALVRTASTEADYQIILDALNTIMLPSKDAAP